MGKATQDLRNEHDTILRVLKIMDKMITPDPEDSGAILSYYHELVHFLKIFADKCHHGKEENFLFEDLVKNGVPKEGGPVGAMLREHVQGREYIALMSKSLDSQDIKGFIIAAVGYQSLLRIHIEKENNVLFVMADKLLDDTMQDELFEKFEQYEESVMGHGVHEELHAMIHRWEHNFEGHL